LSTLVLIILVGAAFHASLADATHVAPFVGGWQNDDAASDRQTRAVIGLEGANFQVYGYGACTPSECDWAARVGGPRTTPQADASDGQLSVTWDFGFQTMAQTLILLPDGRLHITSTTHFTDGSGRPDQTANEDFHRTTAPVAFYTVTVETGGTGMGKVTSTPAGIDCPAACSLEFASGTLVTLTAEPEDGSKLASWTSGCAHTELTCSMTISADTTATAVFRTNPPCVVPRLKGLTLANAKRALASAHCKLAAVKRAYSQRVKRGRVISQKPAAGRRLPPGGPVIVLLSRGRRR
jgi:hypothetical protein